MAAVMNFFKFFILIALLQYGEAKRHFQISENIVYDCVDIYKQPAFEHPLLKNHKIQMRPSISITEPKTGVSNKGSQRKIDCPVGTVPILRTRKEDLTIAQQFSEKHFTPLTAEQPGAHIATMRSQIATGQARYHGVGVEMSVHELNVGKDQASYAQAFVGGGDNGQINVIQAGWMKNPSVFGDARTWSFGFWKGKNGAGCYNTACPGFVQVATNDPLSEPLNITSSLALLQFSIHQDKQTGNWWISHVTSDATIDVGYWPKELFNLIGDGAMTVGFGGAVQASPSGSSPPMGNGRLPTRNIEESAFFSNLEITDFIYETFRADSFPLEQLVDSPTCYRLNYQGYRDKDFGVVFTYGGPGGGSCGV